MQKLGELYLVFLCYCYSMCLLDCLLQKTEQKVKKKKQSLNISQCGSWLKSGSVSLCFPLACVLCLFSVLVKSIVIDIGSLIIILYECIDFYSVSLFYRVFFFLSRISASLFLYYSSRFSIHVFWVLFSWFVYSKRQLLIFPPALNISITLA